MHIWGLLLCPFVLLSKTNLVDKKTSVLLSQKCSSVVFKFCSFVLLSPLLFCPFVLLSQKCSSVVFKFCSFVLLSTLLFCPSVLLSKKQNSFVLLSHPQLRFSVLLSNNRYSLLFVSIQIVTGPSLMSATFISAPNSPVPTSLPIRLERVEQKYS